MKKNKQYEDSIRNVSIGWIGIIALGLLLASCSSTYHHVGTGEKMNKKCGQK